MFVMRTRATFSFVSGAVLGSILTVIVLDLSRSPQHHFEGETHSHENLNPIIHERQHVLEANPEFGGKSEHQHHGDEGPTNIQKWEDDHHHEGY